MPITVTWYIPKRVISIQLDGDIRDDELHGLNQQLHHMLNVSEPLVHVLVDQTHIGKFPINLKEIRETLTVMQYEGFGNIIMYGKVNPLGEFVSGMLARMAGLKLRTFLSAQGAQEFLLSQDVSLESHFSDV